MTVAIFGGTFNPIHNGHLIVAREVLEGLGLSEVIFVPAGRPWMRKGEELEAPEDRLRMVDLAIREDKDFRSSSVEIDREGETYTIDTLRGFPIGNGLPVVIVGADALGDLPNWKEAAEVAERARIAAVGRPGTDMEAVVDVVRERVPGLQVEVVHAVPVGVSATQIRGRLRKGQTIRNLVPPAVEEYIKSRGLYGSPQRKRGELLKNPDPRVRRVKQIEEEKAILKGSFTLASGATSTYYLDGRKATHDAEGAALIGEIVADLIGEDVRAVGGPSTAANPIITATQLAAYRRGRKLGGFYVRTETKKHGTKRLVEGNLPGRGQAVVIVDDTMTTGGSVFHAIAAVEAEGCQVERVILVVDRGEGGAEALRAKGYEMTSLLTADAEGNLSYGLGT